MVALHHKTRRQPAPSSHLLQPENPMQDVLANGVACGWDAREEMEAFMGAPRGFQFMARYARLLYGGDSYDGAASAQRDDTYDERGELDLRVPESAADYSFEGQNVWGKKILAFWLEPRQQETSGPPRSAVLVWDKSDIMDCGTIQGPGQEILPPELYRKLLD